MFRANKIKWIIASAVVAMVLAAGVGLLYINQTKNQSKIIVSENQKNIEVKKGQELTISLTSNPSTGYSWSVDDMYNKNIIFKIGNEFEASSSKKIGAPGKELWLFKAKNEGNTKLNFRYTRLRGNDTTQLSLKSFNITVK
jgi:predicted secreted protein